MCVKSVYVLSNEQNFINKYYYITKYYYIHNIKLYNQRFYNLWLLKRSLILDCQKCGRFEAQHQTTATKVHYTYQWFGVTIVTKCRYSVERTVSARLEHSLGADNERRVSDTRRKFLFVSLCYKTNKFVICVCNDKEQLFTECI